MQNGMPPGRPQQAQGSWHGQKPGKQYGVDFSKIESELEDPPHNYQTIVAPAPAAPAPSPSPSRSLPTDFSFISGEDDGEV
jgi:hypothetical protein